VLGGDDTPGFIEVPHAEVLSAVAMTKAQARPREPASAKQRGCIGTFIGTR